jgi:DNA-directed RNA polymerase subunit H (RpoH/RPB5)
MNSPAIDHILRSRKTLLNILASRGYNTTPYENFGYDEIEAMLVGGDAALRMDLERPADSTDTGVTKCTVRYVLTKLKQKIPGYLSSELPNMALELREGIKEETFENYLDPATTEAIVMLVDDSHPMADIFTSAALNQWNKSKFRLSFFLVDHLVNNPAEHVLVPKHERVPLAEHAELLKQTYAKKTQFPLIVFHQDIQARILGLVPGDIVKITRPSPSAGYYVEYRVCAP